MKYFKINPTATLRVLLLLFSLGCAALVKKFFRPRVDPNQLDGTGYLVWGVSLFFIFGMLVLTPVLISLTGILNGLKFQTMTGVLLGGLAYEVSQVFRAGRRFDWRDFLATLLGGFGTIFIEVILTRIESTDIYSQNDRKKVIPGGRHANRKD